jgi:hypothetical protein
MCEHKRQRDKCFPVMAAMCELGNIGKSVFPAVTLVFANTIGSETAERSATLGSIGVQFAIKILEAISRGTMPDTRPQWSPGRGIEKKILKNRFGPKICVLVGCGSCMGRELVSGSSEDTFIRAITRGEVWVGDSKRYGG